MQSTACVEVDVSRGQLPCNQLEKQHAAEGLSRQDKGASCGGKASDEGCGNLQKCGLIAKKASSNDVCRRPACMSGVSRSQRQTLAACIKTADFGNSLAAAGGRLQARPSRHQHFGTRRAAAKVCNHGLTTGTNLRSGSQAICRACDLHTSPPVGCEISRRRLAVRQGLLPFYQIQ